MAPSESASEMLSKAKRLVPPLLDKFHKGQHGRVAVVGGSEDYTGAPYFSAMASAKLGCDMSHVICDLHAGPVIKSYSPNLMVHPYLRGSSSSSSSSAGSQQEVDKAVAKRIADSLLPRLHTLIVGPGLSRDGPMLAQAALVLRAARDKGLAVVIDADGLGLVTDEPDRVKGWGECVLTPNVVEFERLCKAMGIDKASSENDNDDAGLESRVRALAKALDGPVILAKGKHDIISAPKGIKTIISDGMGGLKRSGGQGDTLTGALGTMLAWRKGYHDGLWGHEDGGKEISREETMLLAALAGSALTRECSRLAYEKKGRSLQAGDLTEEVHVAFQNIFGTDEGESKL